MLSLLARFMPVLPSWATVRMVLTAAACIACFWAGISVRGWIADSQESKAWKLTVDNLRIQAKADKARLTKIDNRLSEIDKDARAWRQKYRDLQRTIPEVKAWADVPHPPAIGVLLNSASPDMPGKRDP